MGIDVADGGRVQPRVAERGLDGDFRTDPVGIEAAPRCCVAARAEAEDLAVNPCASFESMFTLFENRIPPLRRGPSRRVGRRTAGRHRWFTLPVRHLLEQAHADQAERMDLRVGSAGDHHVGAASSDDPARLADRQVRGGLGLGDRVAGCWQSSKIEMWQASILGRYFKSQIGGSGRCSRGPKFHSRRPRRSARHG